MPKSAECPRWSGMRLVNKRNRMLARGAGRCMVLAKNHGGQCKNASKYVMGEMIDGCSIEGVHVCYTHSRKVRGIRV